MAILIYDPCFLVITNEADGFGVVGLQTNDSLGLSNDKENVVQGQKKQFLNFQNPIIFNGCILTIGNNNVLFLEQKNQAQKL
jgi:hypothetical protein